MEKPAVYKVVAANYQKVEGDINDLADKGWKVISVTSYLSEQVLVILENPSALTERKMVSS